MQIPNFQHRLLPSGGEPAEFNNIDLYSAIVGKIEDIHALNDIIRSQFEHESGVVISPETNLNLLNQIQNHLADLETVAEWLVNNFHIQPIADEIDEPIATDLETMPEVTH